MTSVMPDGLTMNLMQAGCARLPLRMFVPMRFSLRCLVILSLRSKPLHSHLVHQIFLAPTAGGSARKPASPASY